MTQAQEATGRGRGGLALIYAGLVALLVAAYALAAFVLPAVFGGGPAAGPLAHLMPFFAAMQTGSVATRRLGHPPHWRLIGRLAPLLSLLTVAMFVVAGIGFFIVIYGVSPLALLAPGDIGIAAGLLVLLFGFFLLTSIAGLWLGGRVAGKRMARSPHTTSDQGD